MKTLLIPIALIAVVLAQTLVNRNLHQRLKSVEEYRTNRAFIITNQSKTAYLHWAWEYIRIEAPTNR